jgi:hypothetical protein
MENTEIRVIQNAGTINFNFEEIRDKLAAEMAHYKGMLFTEETKKAAKETIADLRKLKNDVNGKRIEIKKAYMLPYDEFEAKVKELDALIDEPIVFINGQIEDFEHKRIEERKQLIQQIYEENISDMQEFLPLQRIYDKKWENATTSKKAIKNAISERVESAKKDIDTIRAMNSDDVPHALELYKRTFSLADAIAHINKYEQQKAEILKREEEKKVDQKEVQADIPSHSAETSFTEVKKTDFSGTVTYRMKADRFQIAQIEYAMRKCGIEFERI